MLKWPNPQDYREAIQHPFACFSDEELRSGSVELDGLQLPSVQCGQFAAVFKIDSGANSWAVRCFLRNFADCIERYSCLSEFLRVNPMQHFVEFQILEKGIRVNEDWFPILKMRFVDGSTFGEYIRRNLNDRTALSELLVEFEHMLLTLKTKGIAHGDLQHDNILVRDGRLLLVDYDGLYLPSINNLPNHELGHPNYQHPARCHKHYGPYLDNFAGWLIKSGLEYLIQKPDCLEAVDSDSLLFRSNDLISPQTSKNFFELETQGGAARIFSRRIRTLIQMPVEQIPYIDQPFGIDSSLSEITPAETTPTGLHYGFRNAIDLNPVEEPGQVGMKAFAIPGVEKAICKWERETGNYCHRCATRVPPRGTTQAAVEIPSFFTRTAGLTIIYLAYILLFGPISGHIYTVWDSICLALCGATMETVFGGTTILATVLLDATFCDGRSFLVLILINLFIYVKWNWCPYAFVPVKVLLQKASNWAFERRSSSSN